jgi:hypothetical protein
MAAMMLLRTVLVWLLLLALPYQGFASASMLCVPSAPAAPLMDGQHDHAAMMHEHAAMADTPAHSHSDGSAHSPARCGGVAACCIGAALAPHIVLPPSLPPPPSELIPFHAVTPAPVDLAVPDRPPKTDPA